MKPVKYSSQFKKVIEFAKNKEMFLGTGNPSGKIVFIGKEAAIDEKLNPNQHLREIRNNTSNWANNTINEIQFSDIDNWFITPNYNPLYPYKGQKYNVESRNKEGEIVRGKGGTSKTWYNYQKIINHIYFQDTPNTIINYHEYSFSSELNQYTGPYSKTIPKKIRKESIDKRKELFQQPFFKQFTITILAVGHYVRDFDIDLQDVFQMNFHEEHSKELSEELNTEYINIHYDDLEKPTKLLIHTNQLSMVSNELVTRLGEICNDFLKNK
jgi:hypothetical protein